MRSSCRRATPSCSARSAWRMMKLSGLTLTLLLTDIVLGSSDNYTDVEKGYMSAFDWCVGGNSTIQWIDKSEGAVEAKVSAGARFAPARNEEGEISDLNEFVQDRLSVLPSEVVLENLPSLIIENECASVLVPDEKCMFDYAATPAPLQWALQHELQTSSALFEARVPTNIMNWERDDMTVVYVPASDSVSGAEELTNSNPEDPELAKLGTRGNSSRKSPKKQMKLKLPKSKTLIPGGAEDKDWILSAYLSDRTYIENKVVFDMYRKIGELQKQFSDTWPTVGSVEDLAAQAFSPRFQKVNLIFQGRYAGIYNLGDKVEEKEGRVWLPEPSEEPVESKEVGGIKLPTGSYLLGRDWSEQNKLLSNPDREVTPEDEANQFYVPSISDAEKSINSIFFGDNETSFMAWAMEAPDDKSFADYEVDEDVRLLRGFLLQLHSWLEDPIKNEEILSEVIDMPSIARYFLTAEVAREVDDYVASMYFKVVDGKLYHASLWDYAGTSFPPEPCSSSFWAGIPTVDPVASEYADPPICNENTGNLFTAGWHSRDLHFGEALSICPILPEPGCSKGAPIQIYWRWFFGQLFRIPALQSEFWKLWDIVSEHGLIEKNGSEQESGDLFSLDLFVDQILEPVRATVKADRMMWQMIEFFGLIQVTEKAVFGTVDPTVCKPLLEASLLATVGADNTSTTDPLAIPGQHWAFHTAAMSGKFTEFFYSPELGFPDDVVGTVADYFDNDALLTKKKEYFKHRLEWMASQRPDDNGSAPNDDNSTSPSDDNGSVPKDDNSTSPPDDNGSVPKDDNSTSPPDDDGSAPSPAFVVNGYLALVVSILAAAFLAAV